MPALRLQARRARRASLGRTRQALGARLALWRVPLRVREPRPHGPVPAPRAVAHLISSGPFSARRGHRRRARRPRWRGSRPDREPHQGAAGALHELLFALQADEEGPALLRLLDAEAPAPVRRLAEHVDVPAHRDGLILVGEPEDAPPRRRDAAAPRDRETASTPRETPSTPRCTRPCGSTRRPSSRSSAPARATAFPATPSGSSPATLAAAFSPTGSPASAAGRAVTKSSCHSRVRVAASVPRARRGEPSTAPTTSQSACCREHPTASGS